MEHALFTTLCYCAVALVVSVAGIKWLFNQF